MASKRFYSKTVKDSMTEGKDLQTLYEELNGMSDAERETRISDIDAEIDEIARVMLNRQMNPNSNAQKTESLKQRVEKLRKEQKMLKLFPKVRKKLKRIANAQKRAKAQKIEKRNEAERIYRRLKTKLRQIEEQIEGIDQEIEEVKETMKTLKGKRVKEAMQTTLADLEQEKSRIGDIEPLREEVRVAKAEFKNYTERKK